MSYISINYNIFLNSNFQLNTSHLPEENSNPEPVYYSFPGLEEEIEGIARHIKNSFIAGGIKNLDSVIVAFPAPGVYVERVSRIFKKYGIPHSLCGLRHPALMKPFLDIIALLESIADNYPRLKFSQFLVSPYFKTIPRSFKTYIPRLSLISGITKGRESWFTLLETGHCLPDGEFMTRIRKSELLTDMKRLFKLLEPLESTKESGGFRQYSERILDLLKKLGFSASGQEHDDFGEYISQVLQEIAFADDISASCEPPLTLRSFIDFLKHIVNGSRMEREDIGVKVMGLSELHGLEPEYLYIGGLTDAHLPLKPDIDHILPDTVRTRFGLFNLDKYLLLQKFVFFRTMGSAGKIHISYPSMEGDRLFLPSPYLPWNREICQRGYGIFSKEEELIMKGKNPFTAYLAEVGELGKKAIDQRFGETVPVRVTTIDSYRTCPRKFFIEKVLGLEPLEIKKYEVEATILGTIMHEIMQKVISITFTDLEDLAAMAAQVIDTIITNHHIEQYWGKVIRNTFLMMLPDLYKIEKKIIDEGYAFSEAEADVSGEIVHGIMLKGKIDRIDRKIRDAEGGSRLDTVVELIDYKTGAPQLSGPQVLAKGASLQLFLYAALMKNREVTVDRVGIYSLKDMRVSWIPGRNDRKEGRTMDDYIKASLGFLRETVSQMRKGNFHAIPLNDQTCRNCPESPYCPYVQRTVMVHV
jgi:ATP-dependent helicase/DNAse subunit B